MRSSFQLFTGIKSLEIEKKSTNISHITKKEAHKIQYFTTEHNKKYIQFLNYKWKRVMCFFLSTYSFFQLFLSLSTRNGCGNFYTAFHCKTFLQHLQTAIANSENEIVLQHCAAKIVAIPLSLLDKFQIEWNSFWFQIEVNQTIFILILMCTDFGK